MGKKYTLHITPVADHLEVFIPELNITVETRPGKTADTDALDAAHLAIERYHLAQREGEQEAIKAKA